MTRPRDRQRGVALLLVLWVFMILGVLALDFSRYMRDDAMASLNLSEETRGYYLAIAGMQQAIYYHMLNARQPADIDDDEDGTTALPARVTPADGEWHQGTIFGGRFEVKLSDEEGRISINKAPDWMLRKVIMNLALGGDLTRGVGRREQASIDVVVDSILDWRDTDSEQRGQGAERGWYLANMGYEPKDGWLESMDELLMVRGVTPELFYGVDGSPGLRDVFSASDVFGGESHDEGQRLHAKSLTAPVLQALLGLDPAAAQELVAQRADDFTGFAERLKVLALAVDPNLADMIDTSDARRVFLEARADISQPRNQARIAALVQLPTPEEAEDLKYHRWFDRAPWQGALPSAEFGDPGVQ
ncbi:MAG: general secretion pathway protein GspK [bacterium]|nr:general secretion pathway protein GspK [bacterium]